MSMFRSEGQARSLIGLPPKQILAMALAERARRQRLQQARNGPVRPQFNTEHRALWQDENSPYSILGKRIMPDGVTPIRWKILHGGRGGRKSWEVADYLVRRAASEPIRWLCTREYQKSIRDSVHKLISDTIWRLGLQSWYEITQHSIRSKAGAEFIFMGLSSNINEVKSLEGLDGAWLEEGQSTSINSLQVLDPTIRKEGSEIIITLNRENETDPVDEMIEHPDIDCLVVKVGWKDNPDFPAVLERQRQKALKAISDADNSDEREQAQVDYDWIWEGMHRKRSKAQVFAGRYVIEEFDDNLYMKADRLLYGADYGFAQDAATLIRMFIIDERLYIEYEAWGTGIELDEMEQFWDSVPGSRMWPIKADSARPETTSHMNRHGFQAASAAKWAGSVEDGVAHMKGFRKIVIHPRCKHTIEEFKLYKFKVDKITGEVLPVIVDAWNHCIDAIRYGLDGFIQRRGHLGIWAKLGGK